MRRKKRAFRATSSNSITPFSCRQQQRHENVRWKSQRAIRREVILLCIAATGRSFSPRFSLSLERALTLYASTYATDGRVVKRIKKTGERSNSVCQAQKRERACCVVDIRTYICIVRRREKAFSTLFARRSPSVSYVLLFFGTFLPSFSRSLVFVDIRARMCFFSPITSLFFSLSTSLYCLVLVRVSWEKREREKAG